MEMIILRGTVFLRISKTGQEFYLGGTESVYFTVLGLRSLYFGEIWDVIRSK